jgi:tetratricopeptide (TPR) repeat protein
MALSRERKEELRAAFRKHFAERRYVKAIEVCIELVEEDYQDALGWRNLGAAYMALEHDDEALKVLNRAAALAPEDALTRYNIGVVLSRKGKHAEAMNYYERAVALAPDLAQGYLGLASSCYHLGDLDGALYHYSQAYLMTPDNAELASNFGATLARAGQHSRAAFYFRQAIALSPEWTRPRVELGEALRQSGSFRDAIRELLRALRVERTPAGLTTLVLVYLGAGKIEKAIRRADEAVALNPAYAPAHRVRGLCLSRLRSWPEAIRSFEEAYRLAPDDFDAVLELAYVLAETSQELERAHAMVSAVLARDRRNVRALDVMGWCLYRQGQFQDSLRELEKARQLLETGGVISDAAMEVYRHLTTVYEAVGDTMMANEMWLRTGDKGPRRY